LQHRDYTLHVNGSTRRVSARPDEPLLWVLRDQLRLTGAKFGCGEGMCGACSVLINGRSQRTCRLAVSAVADGREIVAMTVEQENRMERAIDPQGRSGQQWDAWEAMFSPRDPVTGLPVPMFDTETGAIDRAVDLCAQTLSFTREGPASLDLSRFELGDLVNDVGESLPERVNGKAVWQNRLGQGIEVEADRQQLFRVFSNLALNAVEAGATRVDVSGERDDRRLIVHIADNGPGLPPRAREKLFQPFSGSARPGGTGLGLAIARDLVRAHGGDISLESSDVTGTCFRLTLPLSQTDR